MYPEYAARVPGTALDARGRSPRPRRVPMCYARARAWTRVGQNVPYCETFSLHLRSGLCGRPGLAPGHPLGLEGISEGLNSPRFS